MIGETYSATTPASPIPAGSGDLLAGVLHAQHPPTDRVGDAFGLLALTLLVTYWAVRGARGRLQTAADERLQAPAPGDSRGVVVNRAGN